MLERARRKFVYDTLKAGQRSPSVEQPSKKKPFAVRAHHVFSLRGLDSYYTPADMSRNWRESAESNSRDPDYYGDVYGPTRKTADTVEASHRDVMGTYMDLPNDYPLVIVEGKPDSICGAAAQGAHCEKLNLDDEFLDAFLNHAGEKELVEYIQVVTPDQDVSKGANPKREVLLSKGTFRVLMQDMDAHFVWGLDRWDEEESS